jgi:DNA helicase HerA-like ATPase
MTLDLQALQAVDFQWVRPLESIWVDDDFAIAGPNAAAAAQVAQRFFRETQDPGAHPNGAVLTGQSGIGKTHLVGQLRRKVWRDGGWFVLLDVLGLNDFWRSAALSYITSLLQPMPDGRRQFEAVIAGVARRFKVEAQVETAFKTPSIDVAKIVNVLLNKALIPFDMTNALRHQDVFRALCLLRSLDASSVGLAYGWLQGYDADAEARAALGFRQPPPAPAEIVRGMSWVMSVAGPTLIGVDQIDGVVNPSFAGAQAVDDFGGQSLGEALAAGLLDLHTVGHRSMTVLTCLFDSWRVLRERGLAPFVQRFHEPIVLRGMNASDMVHDLIVSRVTPAYAAARFTPPFASWPFTEQAIAGAAAVALTPRAILMRCDAFRRRCVDAGAASLCDSLVDDVAPAPKIKASNGFADEFRRLSAAADVSGLITPSDDDGFSKLLRETLDLYVREIEPDEEVDVESRGDPAERSPPLHGRVTFTYHAQNDRERHFCFRALEHPHAISFQARLRAALTASGISPTIADRRLALVRRSPIPSGLKTKQLFDAFETAGGIVIDPADADLRAFVALRQMRERAAADKNEDAFLSWLRAEQPLHATPFFQQAGLSPTPGKPAGPAAPPPPPPREPVAPPPPPRAAPKAAPAAAPADAIPVGRRIGSGEETVSLPIRLLRRHTAIIAGSGSGKTVLLRRLVEEAALAGVPAIVIDPNNDLARLGEAWPTRPPSFTVEDDEKARRYRETVEVVVWTPGVRAGNPLYLSILPDFASLGDDPDERQQAVDMAAETLAPLAGAKNALQRGVLIEALRRFAETGGGGLPEFTRLLEDLPDGLSPIGAAAKLAAGMADQLHAAVATHPLLRAEGPVLDPERLFFGDRRRVRISVINLSGLASDAAREDFVNRLQMTLFGWIKTRPSARGLLYVIDEAQIFVPSQKPAASLGSGLKLIAQARKYGLGMVVATQAPRGIHNQVVSNCTTQFLGRQSAPATIAAAQEIIAASGGRADDIGKLQAGEFYFSTEGSGKPGKLRAPICLTFHPPSPPTPDQVVTLAKASASTPSPAR